MIWTLTPVSGQVQRSRSSASTVARREWPNAGASARLMMSGSSMAHHPIRLPPAALRQATSALEQRHAFDVRGLRKHVDGAHTYQAPAGLGELRRVRSEGRRVAGDIDDPPRSAFDDPPHDPLRKAGTRRINDEHVRTARVREQLAQSGADIASVEGHVVDLVERGVGARVGNRLLDEL